MIKIYFIPLALMVIGCTSLGRVVPEYILVEKNGVMASSSPTLFFNKADDGKREWRGDSLFIQFPLLLKNVSTDVVTVGLDRADVLINRVSHPANCTSTAHANKKLFLHVNGTIKVLCQMSLKPDEKNNLQTAMHVRSCVLPSVETHRRIWSFQWFYA